MTRIFTLFILVLWHLCVFAERPEENADSLAALGQEYYRAERYMDALDVLARAMDVADQTNNTSAYLQSLLIIGNTYTLFDDYEQALHYYSQCLEKANAVKDKSVCSKAKCNMLLCYSMLGKVHEAQMCYESIVSLNTGDVDQNRFYTYVNQALLARVKKNYKAAIYLYTQAMNYAENHKMDGRFVAAEMGQIATMYEDCGEKQKAIEWYLKCKSFSEKGKFVGPLTSTYERLAGIYREMGDNDLAAKYQEQFVHLQDSFFQQREFNSKRSIINSYENKRSDRLVSSLTSTNTRLIWIIVTFVAFLAVCVTLLIYIYRQNRRLVHTQHLLIEKHKEHSHQLQVQNEIIMSLTEKNAEIETPESDVKVVIKENSSSNVVVEATNEDMETASEETVEKEENLLPKQQADHLLASISHVMEDNSVICDPDFSLGSLAQLVDSNTRYVSWIINKNYNKNFKTYLNEYRIRAASQLLTDNANFGNLTIAAIAEQVGYKSPTSFHQAFKKIYGMTPAAYVKLAQSE